MERLVERLSSQPGAGLSVFAIDHDAMLDRVRARLFGAASSPEGRGPRTRVGRFEVTRRIGAGAAGVVFLARDLERGRDVALKLLRPWFRGDAALRRAALEVRLRAAATERAPGPRVIPIRAVGRARGRLFIAMDHFDARPLPRWIAARRRATRAIIDVFKQAGQGLAELHAAGLAHGTFTPAAVLVADDGAARVTELARAALLELPGGSLSATQRAALTGATRYLSPEELTGRERDARSDQFRFCVALYEALVGAPPFGGATLDELVLRVTRGQRERPPREHELPTRVLGVIARGLEPDPGERWPTMRALLSALDRS